MKRLTLLMAVLLVSAANGLAQHKNTFELGIGSYWLNGNNASYPNNEYYSVFNAKYQRTLNDHWSVFANYTTASTTGWAFDFETSIIDINSIGKIESRLRYQFIDLGASYSVLSWKHHTLSVGAAPSLAWGKNAYKTALVLAPGGINGQGDIINVEYKKKTESYFGGTGSIDYNYSFLKDRLVAGLSFYARYYMGNMPSMFNYNVHIGVRL